MLRKLRHQVLPLSHLEIFKIESRRYGASHQRVRLPIPNMGGKPAPRAQHCLMCLPHIRRSSQKNRRVLPTEIDHMHQKWRPLIEVPHLIRPQPVKRRKVLPLEQKVNRRRNCSRPAKTCGQRLTRDRNLRPIGLPEISAFRMRLQPQSLHPIPRIFLLQYLSSLRQPPGSSPRSPPRFCRIRETFSPSPALSRY